MATAVTARGRGPTPTPFVARMSATAACITTRYVRWRLQQPSWDGAWREQRARAGVAADPEARGCGTRTGGFHDALHEAVLVVALLVVGLVLHGHVVQRPLPLTISRLLAMNPLLALPAVSRFLAVAAILLAEALEGKRLLLISAFLLHELLSLFLGAYLAFQGILVGHCLQCVDVCQLVGVDFGGLDLRGKP